MRRRLFLLLALSPLALQAQNQTPTLTLRARTVILDTAVADEAGHPILDLTKDDFHVTEDKVPQTIRTFEPPSAHLTPANAPIVHTSADLDKIGNAPITVLILDELNMTFGDEVYARDRVAKWIAAQPQTLAQPTLLVAVTYKDLHVLVDTTQDRDKLLTTLKHHYATYPWRSYNAGTVGGAASDQLAATIGALEQIAQALRGVPGRKNAIWVGDGFPSVQQTDIAETASKAITEQLHQLSAKLLTARVTLSILGPTIHPPNTPQNEETTSDVFNGVSAVSTIPLGGSLQFADLAPPTGGQAYRGRNDLDKELAEVVSAGSTYYTLTYTPTDPSENPQKYRKIAVTFTRPGLHAITRDGYYPQPSRDPSLLAPIPSRLQLGFDLMGAANSTLPYTDLHVTPTKLDRTHFDLNVHAAELGWLHKPDGSLQASEIVMSVFFDHLGHTTGRSFDPVGASTQANEAQLLGREATFHLTLKPLPAGTTRIRFVVRDTQSGRVGAADTTP